MKVIYTESDVTQSAAQLIMCPLAMDGKPTTPHERHFHRAFPEAVKVAGAMLNSPLVEEDIRPHLGDVIWVDSGGNREIGFCLVREGKGKPLNMKAVKASVACVSRRAKDLNQLLVGMDLFACRTSKQWAKLVPHLERNMTVQAVCCVPENKLLMQVLDRLPEEGKINVFRLPREPADDGPVRRQ